MTGLIPLDLQLSLAGGTPLYNATLSATVNDSGAPDKCPSDVFGLQPPSGTSPNPAFSVTEILPQKYTIAIDDVGDGAVTNISVTVAASGVTYNGTNYTGAVPVTVS